MFKMAVFFVGVKKREMKEVVGFWVGLSHLDIFVLPLDTKQ